MEHIEDVVFAVLAQVLAECRAAVGHSEWLP